MNPVPDGPRRKGLRAGGNLLIGFSGGLGSTVLLDLVNRTYFAYEPLIEAGTGKPRGGKGHPRNTEVWSKGFICYVETCSAFPCVRPCLTFHFNEFMTFLTGEGQDGGDSRCVSKIRPT